MQLIAHRGGRGFGLENTLDAMDAAVRAGVDMMETDVRCTIDNKLVICHDATLWGRFINKLTLEQLRRSNPERPTLDDVLDLLKGRCQLNLEVKAAPESLVGRTLKKNGVLDGTLVTSFSRLFLRRFKLMFPEMETGYLFRSSYHKEKKVITAVEIGARTLLPHFHSVDDELVKVAHREGLKVYTWTVNREEDLERLGDMGIEGVITDRYLDFHDYLAGVGTGA